MYSNRHICTKMHLNEQYIRSRWKIKAILLAIWVVLSSLQVVTVIYVFYYLNIGSPQLTTHKWAQNFSHKSLRWLSKTLMWSISSKNSCWLHKPCKSPPVFVWLLEADIRINTMSNAWIFITIAGLLQWLYIQERFLTFFIQCYRNSE